METQFSRKLMSQKYDVKKKEKQSVVFFLFVRGVLVFIGLLEAL